MKRRLVIFGAGDIAQLAHFYFGRETEFEVVAFSVDAAFVKEPTFCGLPVIAFQEILTLYPPQQNAMFIAVGYSKLNAVRKEKYLAAKALGYQIASFKSPRATILNEGRLGDNCFILEDVTIQPFVTIGNNVTLWCGSTICHHSIIEDHCFLASHVIVSGGVDIGEQCFIGANATLRDHIKIGEKCVVGAGALLLSDAAPEGVYLGQATERSKSPARG